MLPECDLEGAATKAEAVRLAVATLAIPHAASPSGDQVTLSIGVAAAIPSLQTHPDTLVSAADAQLYQAKVEGRDRVRAAP